MQVNIDQAVEAYLNLRSERERLLREYEAEDSKLKEAMTEIDEMLLSICRETNVNSLRTNHGTVIRKIKERYTCSDWDAFRQFEFDNPDYDFREKRIHQGNFKTYMEQHEGDGLPPGVNTMREFQIEVRKSTK